jgi:hypothetical protein
MAGKSRVWFWLSAAVSLLACLYCALWILSAASLASGYCGDRFSLFAEEFRCRQVHIAMLLTLGFGVISGYLGWRAVRADRRKVA